MSIQELLKDKSRKSKEKTELISQWLVKGSISLKELLAYANECSDKEKATCIEAIEFSTRNNPSLADTNLLKSLSIWLMAENPRVKWEAARVVANIAAKFPNKLDAIIAQLLSNTEDAGTVVRWATALALGEILLLDTKHNKELLPALETIASREEENGVKKKYLDAIKKLKKLQHK